MFSKDQFTKFIRIGKFGRFNFNLEAKVLELRKKIIGEQVESEGYVIEPVDRQKKEIALRVAW